MLRTVRCVRLAPLPAGDWGTKSNGCRLDEKQGVPATSDSRTPLLLMTHAVPGAILSSAGPIQKAGEKETKKRKAHAYETGVRLEGVQAREREKNKRESRRTICR